MISRPGEKVRSGHTQRLARSSVKVQKAAEEGRGRARTGGTDTLAQLASGVSQQRRVGYRQPEGGCLGPGLLDVQQHPRLAHLRKGASRLMLCQKVVGFRLGSASTEPCCWGELVGSAGCRWRVR